MIATLADALVEKARIKLPAPEAVDDPAATTGRLMVPVPVKSA